MNALLILFTVSLLLPRNLSGLEEVFWSTGLILLGIQKLRKRAFHTAVPRALIFAFVAYIIVAAVSLLVSRSPALSVFFMVRLVSGLAACLLAGAGGTHAEAQSERSLKILGRFAILLSLGSIGIQFIPLPPYNSLTALNGHYPLAYLLVFLLPLIFYPGRKVVYADALLFVAGLLVSAARGAWIILTIYTFRMSKTALQIASGFLLLSILSLMFWLSHLPFEQKQALLRAYPPIRYVLKNSDDELRAEYVRQTLESVRTSPLLGNGPGTFELVSRAYQTAPGRFSSYPHSFPLQILSDTGVLGVITASLLFLTVVILVRVMSPLSASVALTLLYSVFEGNLHTYSYWMLLWIIIGALYASRVRRRTERPALLTVLLLALCIFTASIAASVFLEAGGHRTLSVAVAPYRKSSILNALKTHLPDQRMISRWYPMDPDVLATAGRHKDALRYDPRNIAIRQAYLTMLFTEGNTDGLSETLCETYRVLAKGRTTQPCSILSSEHFRRLLTDSSIYTMPLSHLQGNDGGAKFFYFLGDEYHKATSDPEGVVMLWAMARDIAPDWGHYHLELASALHYYQKNDMKASETLMQCLSEKNARNGCLKLGTSLDTLLPPGSLSRDIEAIPALLPL